MRPRIKARVNVQMVVESLEHKRKVYSEAIQNVMKEENLKYSEAKKLLNLRKKQIQNLQKTGTSNYPGYTKSLNIMRRRI